MRENEKFRFFAKAGGATEHSACKPRDSDVYSSLKKISLRKERPCFL